MASKVVIGNSTVVGPVGAGWCVGSLNNYSPISRPRRATTTCSLSRAFFVTCLTSFIWVSSSSHLRHRTLVFLMSA